MFSQERCTLGGDCLAQCHWMDEDREAGFPSPGMPPILTYRRQDGSLTY